MRGPGTGALGRTTSNIMDVNLRSQILAEWVCGFDPSDAEPAVRDTARELLLDFLGVTLAGAAEEESARVAARYAIGQDMEANAEGSSGEASGSDAGGARLWAFGGERTSAELSAFAHATAGHSIEMDDVHNASSLHPGVVTIPAALAAAETRGASGDDLIGAIIAGYEVILRVGAAAGPGRIYERGFHPTAVCGAFSAAAASGKIMGLTAEQLVHAFGLAWNFAAGSTSFQSEGSWAKRLQVGNAARSGVQAARLAKLGALGPAHVFEDDGFFHAYSGHCDASELNPSAGGEPRISEVSLKPFACCRYNHGPIDGLLELRRRHGIDADRVLRIKIGIASAGIGLVGRPIDAKRAPRDGVEAQFSLPYAAAIALIAGRAGRAEHREPWLSDPRVRRLAQTVKVHADPEIDRRFPGKWPFAVRVEMDDGAVHEYEAEDCLGDPTRPLGREGVVDKFNALTEEIIKDAARARVADAVLTLDSGMKVSDLLELIASARRAA